MRASPGETAGVIAPPPLLLLAAVLLGFGLHRLLPLPLVPPAIEKPLGAIVVGAGVVLLGAAVREFVRAGTSVETRRPSTSLVTGGPYRWTRNPIYLSLAILQLGFASLVNSVWLAAMIAPLVFALHFGVILREERYLAKRMGPDYERYLKTARRWI